MKNFVKIFGLIIFFASLLLGTYVISFENKDTLVVSLSTDYKSFDETLAIGIQTLYESGITTGQGKIKIDVMGTEITAVVKMNDLRKLSNGKTDLATFIRNYMSFS